MDVSSRSIWQISDITGSTWQQPGSDRLALAQPRQATEHSVLWLRRMLQKTQWEIAGEEECERAGVCRVPIHWETGNATPTAYLFYHTHCTRCIGKSLEQD